jgi:elongation factor 3
VEIADEDAECLCDCMFTLAYGNNILLFDTKMKLYRGMRYGLLGTNDSGKTTLMRAISKNQVEGFPDSSEVRTVFVEADIVGEQSHLTCVEYIMEDPNIQKYGIKADDVRTQLVNVGFAAAQGKGTAVDDGVSTLSGGWRMKLAMARAMLQKADILLLDEPTNHLDVMNVKWTLDYLKSLKNVTCIIVTHDSKLLEQVTTHMLEIKDLRLKTFKGKLSEFVEVNPDAQAYFNLKKTKLHFTFPQPGYIEGVKSKGKALLKMEGCEFTYPNNTTPTITGITVQVSLSSRVALLGPNGAGKSTLIKLLVGENVPDKNKGKTWKHPGCRFAYVAQHAFAHIEDHLDKTPNEYVRWRYQSGEDKETIKKQTLIETPEELKKQEEVFIYKWRDEESGKEFQAKRTVHHVMPERQMNKSIKSYEYKAVFKGMSDESAVWMSTRQLAAQGWDKACKRIDESEAAKAGMFIKPLTQREVEKHISDVGLAAEYGSHFRMNALSGGQKVKVVLAASLWNQPHILILDEPTNYLDRESLGALSNAIERFEGGCVMITHNNEFCSALCPETWILEKGEDGIARIETKGDAEWMKKKEAEAISVQVQEVVIDASGNETAVEQADKPLDRKEKKALMKQLKAAKKAKDDDLIAEIEEKLGLDEVE